MATPSPTPFAPEEYSADSAGSVLGHGIIPLLHGFYHHGEDDFDLAESDYTSSVLGFLVGVIVLGGALMVLLWCCQIASLCSCWRECCSCCFGFTKNGGRCTVIFLLLLAGGLISGSYLGREEFRDAAVEITDVLRQLADVFGALEESALSMDSQASSYNASAYASNCTPPTITDTLKETASTMSTAVGELVVGVDGISDDLEDAADFFEGEIPKYIDRGLAAVVAAIWFISLSGMLAICTRRYCDDCIVGMLGSLAILALIGLVALEVTVSVTVADFCYKGPDAAVLSAADKIGLDEENLELVEYYVSCNSSHPLYQYMNQTIASIKSLNNTLQGIDDNPGATCDATALSSMSGLISTSIDSILSFMADSDCSVINPIYTQVFYGIICDEFVRGLFFLWAFQSAAGIAIYMAMCTFPCVARSPAMKKDNKIFADDLADD